MTDWISIEDRLPEKDVWVLVLEDDALEWKDLLQRRFINQTMKWDERPEIRVTPARLWYGEKDKEEGWMNARWYLSPSHKHLTHVWNVTHWKPIEQPPESTVLSKKLEARLRRRENDDPNWDK